jgi:predicted ester cyclase
MTIEANKELVRRVGELANARDYDAIDHLVSEDFINHAGGGAVGVEPMKGILREIATCFPDAHYAEDDIVAEGDKVVLMATMTGTHRASTLPFLRGITPTGRQVEWRFIHVFRIAGGRIAEHWARRNDLEVIRELET